MFDKDKERQSATFCIVLPFKNTARINAALLQMQRHDPNAGNSRVAASQSGKSYKNTISGTSGN